MVELKTSDWRARSFRPREPYSVDDIPSDFAEAWRALRIEAARDFPLGSILTVEEVEAVNLRVCRTILRQRNFKGMFINDELVGYCGYQRLKPSQQRHRAEIGPLFVTRVAQRNGYASQLFRSLELQARNDGVTQLELTVDTENHVAIAFFENADFKQTGLHPNFAQCDTRTRNAYSYVKRIEPRTL